MGFFLELVLLVASYLISAAMKPKVHKQNAVPALDSDFNFPQSDEGTPQAIIFGEAWLPNWSVIWHGNYRGTPYQQDGTTIGYTYAFTMLMGLCRGPIDEVVEIDVGGRVLRKPVADGTAPMTGTQTIKFTNDTMFGAAPTGSGGIKGTGYLMMGDAAQLMPANIDVLDTNLSRYNVTSLASLMPGRIPGFRGVTTFLYDGEVGFNQTNPQAWTFRVRRALKGWQNDAPWYPEKAVIQVSSGTITIANPQLSDPNITDENKRKLPRTVDVIETIKGMNPIHALYEVTTNRAWGAGRDASLLDDAAWRDAADICYNENLACAYKWDRSGTNVDDVAQQLINFVMGAVYVDPASGLFTIRLTRGDYNVDTIPTFSYTSGIIAVTDNSAGSGDSTVNQIIVEYTSPVTGQKGSVRAQNIGLIQSSNGAVMSQTNTYDCCPTAQIARNLADRDLKRSSSGLRSLTLQMDRSAWDVLPGDVIRVQNLTDQKIDDMVLRVGKRADAAGTDGKITLTCVQDVYALDTTAYHYTIDTPPTWVPPVPSDTNKTTPAPLITNLRLMQPWDGNQFIIGWDRNADASKYDIQILAGSPQKVVRFNPNQTENTYTYNYQMMLEDGGPWRNIQFQVRAKDALNNAGPWYLLNAGNPQIDYLQDISVTQAMKQAFFQCARPAEGDWAGIVVFISDTKGFAYDDSNKIYDGPNLFVTMTQLPSGTLLDSTKTYYLRAAGYDNFGEDSLNISSEVEFTVMANAPDTATIVGSMIADGALDISKFAQSIAPPLIVNGVPTGYVADLVLNTLDNKLYRWDDTLNPPAYTAAIPASDVEGQLELANIPQIPTTQLTGQISAAQIQANAIGANQIAAGAITAGKIAANAVTAGTIAVGAVGADQIAANSISSVKLVVGDMSNQIDDPGFSYGDLRAWTTADTSKWYVDSTTAGLGSDAGTGVAVAQSVGGAAALTTQLLNLRQMTVNAGDVWYVTAQVKVGLADGNVTTGCIGVRAYKADNSYTDTDGSYFGATTYTQSILTYSVTDSTIVKLQPYIKVKQTGGASLSQKVYFDDTQFIRMSGVTLIQDGAISTTKIQANAVTANQLAANSVTADKIVANTITGDKLAANTITANLLAAGSVTAAALQVGNAPNLVANPGWSNGDTSFWAASNCTVGFPSSTQITGSNEKSVQIIGTTNSECIFDSAVVGCNPNTTYIASAWVTADVVSGLSAYVRFYFQDANGNVVAYQTGAFSGGNAGGGITGYTRAFVKIVSPANAVRMVMGFGMQGGNGHAMYAYRPQIEEAVPNAVGPGAWGSGVNTIIGPGTIRTGSLSAISANLGSITAGALNINGLFIVGTDGRVTIQTATSGQRTVQSGGLTQIFNASNIEVVRLGIW